MKVYVLTLENLHGHESVLGIFSTLEQAKLEVSPNHPHKTVLDWEESQGDFYRKWDKSISIKRRIGTARLSYTISERWVI